MISWGWGWSVWIFFWTLSTDNLKKRATFQFESLLETVCGQTSSSGCLSSIGPSPQMLTFHWLSPTGLSLSPQPIPPSQQLSVGSFTKTLNLSSSVAQYTLWVSSSASLCIFCIFLDFLKELCLHVCVLSYFYYLREHLWSRCWVIICLFIGQMMISLTFCLCLCADI